MEPIKVWAVRVGSPESEAEGTLSLEEDALVFSLEEGDLRLPLADIRKAKRIRGSPVLTVTCAADPKSTSYAFFFVQPPPLHHQSAKDSKRKTRRHALTYLTTTAGDHKEDLIGWEKAIRAAVAARRG